MPGQRVPTWAQVLGRRYEPWLPELPGRLVVDNIGDPAGHIAHLVAELPPHGWDGTGGST
jgi:hypothetical protein